MLVVAGDVTPEEVKTLAQATYGKIERHGPIGERMRPQEPPQIAERRLTFADLRVTQPSFQRSYLVPSYTTAKGGEDDALDILAHILGGGSNSRLYRALVTERRVANNAGAWYQGTTLDATRLGLYATPARGVALDTREGASDDVIADYVYAQDNQSTLARMYGAALTTGSSVEAVQARPERLRAVTPEQVRDAARRYLDKRRSVTGYLVRDAREEKKS